MPVPSRCRSHRAAAVGPYNLGHAESCLDASACLVLVRGVSNKNDSERRRSGVSTCPGRASYAHGHAGRNPLKKDTIFAEHTQAIGDFNFGEKTAAVFEDMLDRSIPLYRELQRMLGEIAAEFAVSGTNVYDLGCSDGITLATLSSAIADAGKQVRLVGVDYSAAMLDKGPVPGRAGVPGRLREQRGRHASCTLRCSSYRGSRSTCSSTF